MGRSRFPLLVNVRPGATGARGQRAAGGPNLTTPYVEDIREGGLSVYDSGLLVGKEAPREVEIVAKTDGGQVDGAVYDAQQRPAAGATVVLVPAESRRQNPALYRVANSNRMGQFAIRGVQSGFYKLFAFEGPSA